MSDFAYTISAGSGFRVKQRLLKTDFGDGYQQRGRNGLNDSKQIWDISIDDLSHSEAHTIRNFFKTKIGVSFTWTPPDATEINVICEEYALKYAGPLANIKCTFEQSFT